jgi:hypothetical protein
MSWLLLLALMAFPLRGAADGGRVFAAGYDIRGEALPGEPATVTFVASVQNTGEEDLFGVTFVLEVTGLPEILRLPPIDLPATGSAAFSFQFTVEPAVYDEMNSGHLQLAGWWRDGDGVIHRRFVELLRVPMSPEVQQ